MNRISEFRKKINLTQQELAKEINITQGAIAHYETGRREPPINIAQRIISVMKNHGIDCTLDELFPAEG
ncbi:helix-turn-helix transcriptional regulator [Rodentibacter haemolyticus]|uniref:Helix-turn-helix transcriptional regulator n=1 Tax=Rodentibacter haemolyticus TaxID=2778911 RepID=A0ABX6UVT8_9PAST|nr:helix-turn-helix transcriptional regulator [Rodentibacter haemolyticus]QPB42197.1 helix-turn-helix transcriptional regulator [Rodentibacter haemolyticus]